MRVAFHTGEPPTLAPLALRVIVVADLGCGGAVLPPRLLRASEDLAELLRAHRPLLRFEVPNLLARTPARLELQLRVEAFADLSPARLVEEVAPLARLRVLAQELDHVAAGKAPLDRLTTLAAAHADLDGVGELLRAAAVPLAAPARGGAAAEPAVSAAAAVPADAAIDRILQLVRVPEAEERAVAAVDRLVAQLAGRGGPAGPVVTGRPAVAAARDRVVALLGRQLDAIVHHPQYRDLETSWRGLKFLVDRTPFRAGVVLEVLHAPRAELVPALAALDAAGFEAGDDLAPPGLIVAPFGFADGAADAELLQHTAEAAERLQVPLLTSITHAFFGLGCAAEAGELRYPGTLLEQVGYTKWNALRRKDCARWLGVAFNPFLLRGLHEPHRAEDLPYRERVASAAEQAWGDPAWAVAALVVRSHGAGGWPTEIVGPARRLEDFPLHDAAGAGQAALNLPVAARLPEALVGDLVREGFIPLSARSNSDSVFLSGAPTLFRPEGERAARVTGLAFPYQLLVSRVVKALDRYRAERAAGRGLEALRDDLQRYLEGLVADTGYGWRVDVELQGERGPDPEPALAIALKVGSDVLGGRSVELSFGLPSRS